MCTTFSKKMLNLLILKILEEYSDSEHLFTQKEIIKLLEKNDSITCDRHSVRNNIRALKELKYEIADTGKGYYLAERSFEDAELVMLIDSVIFSKNLSHTQKNV